MSTQACRWSSSMIYKIWDSRVRRYTNTECCVSRNPVHPGRVYISEATVCTALRVRQDFWGDADQFEVHLFHLDEPIKIKKGLIYV